jgi:quinol monooxygenase YgiN
VILVVGTVRLPPEKLAEARPVMARMIAASRAENGCIDYAYAEDVLDPGLIRVTELWRDRDTLERHFQTDHIAAWRATWPALGIADRNLRRYEVGEPEPT